MSKFGPIMSFLSGKLVTDISTLENQELLELDATDSLETAFESLVHKRVHSAPVFDNEAKKYVGILDMRDFVAYVHNLFTKQQPLATRLQDLMQQKTPTVIVKNTASVFEVMKAFGEQHSHVRIHKLPVVNDEGRVVSMLSQSSLVSWLFQNAGSLGPVVDTPVKELKCGSWPVLHVKKSDKLLDVFGKIVENKITGVGVVDENDLLISNISVTDLHHSVADHLHRIEEPVSSLLESGDHPAGLIALPADASLRTVMAALVQGKVHRVYLFDNSPLVGGAGVVSYSDVIDAVLDAATTEVIVQLVPE